MRELFGEFKSRQIMEFWANDHYTWIYKAVLEKPRDNQHRLVQARVVADPGSRE